VLRLARREPGTLAIGVDTDAAAMRESSRRAASKPARGGLPNALFLAGTIHELPHVFDGHVGELRVTLPWGSLLRSATEPNSEFVDVVLRLLRPGGAFRLLVSITDRDLATGALPLGGDAILALGAAYTAAGFAAVAVREATQIDVEETGSTWAKRLGIPGRRDAWLLHACRPPMPSRTGPSHARGTARHSSCV
jgi:16S rRNA (adenine(1408)-N(1))-methyltransferase